MEKCIWIAIIVFLLAGISAGGFVWYTFSKTYGSITVEAGSVVVAEDYKKGEVKTIAFAEDCPEFDTKIPGRYELTITADGFSRTCVLNVEDTVAPTGEPMPVYMSPGEICEADAFVTNVYDITKVKASFAERPDFGAYGLQQVEIILEDTSGNQSTVVSQLYVLKVKMNESYVWDASQGLPNADWFLEKDGKIQYQSGGLRDVQFDIAGTYPVYLIVDGYPCEVSVEIRDVVAPVITLKGVQGYLNHPIEAGDFVETIEDSTQVMFTYKEEPDWSTEGVYDVVIVATDSAGNSTESPGVLNLIPDTEPPVIMGTGNISVCIGENVSYRNGVSAYDNCDGEISYQIDNTGVDLSRLGMYYASYTATDSSGNTTTRDIKITVMPERKEEVSLDTMYALADKVLAEIITPGMTDYEKAEAIFNWSRWKIGWIGDSQKENWIEAAYDGFVYRKGDCYTYACVSKALLTRAGIPNVDIWRNSTTSSHYWNLVDTGEGWYHFDATPRADKTIIFMWSENEINADEAVRRSHIYDHSLFPTVKAD